MYKPDFVLLVDDDPMTNFLNKTVLEKAQIAKNIFCAENGEDAFLKIHQLEAQENSGVKNLCILLDIDMPVLDGYEFLEELKMSKVNLQVEVYVLSVLSENREKTKLSAYPTAGFIKKPLYPKEVKKLFSNSKSRNFNQTWQKT